LTIFEKGTKAFLANQPKNLYFPKTKKKRLQRTK